MIYEEQYGIVLKFYQCHCYVLLLIYLLIYLVIRYNLFVKSK